MFMRPPPSRTYPLSLHDALPISSRSHRAYVASARTRMETLAATSRCVYSISVGRSSGGSSLPLHSGQCSPQPIPEPRSEEHTSELQSHSDLVCRLLLEKKNTYAR